VNFGKKQVKILNAIRRGEEAAAAERPWVATPPMHDWFLAAEERARQAETERLDRERRISDAEVARRQAQSQMMQDRQREWAMVRGQLRDKVAEYRNAVSAAEAKTNSADDAEAQTGILELAVAERRLAAAEQSYAAHASRSPM
jgi:hypothetical protein